MTGMVSGDNRGVGKNGNHKIINQCIANFDSQLTDISHLKTLLIKFHICKFLLPVKQ